MFGGAWGLPEYELTFDHVTFGEPDADGIRQVTVSKQTLGGWQVSHVTSGESGTVVSDVFTASGPHIVHLRTGDVLEWSGREGPFHVEGRSRVFDQGPIPHTEFEFRRVTGG